MKKLTIRTVILEDYYDMREKDEFYLDGEKIGEGYYGGEPEDNSKGRDYRWVSEVIQKIAESLGAELELKQDRVNKEDFY